MDKSLDVFADLADLATDIAREIRLQGRARLTPTQIQVMRYLHANPGATPSQIASATELRRGNVSPVLTQLRAIGFIDSERDRHDARSARITATTLADQTLAGLRASWAALISDAWPSEVDALAAAEALRTLLAGLIEARESNADR